MLQPNTVLRRIPRQSEPAPERRTLQPTGRSQDLERIALDGDGAQDAQRQVPIGIPLKSVAKSSAPMPRAIMLEMGR